MPCRTRATAALGALWLAASAAAAAAAPAPLPVTIQITRVAPDTFRVEYDFAEPVQALDFGPPIEQYRATAWRALSPSLVLHTGGDAERLVHRDGKPFRRALLSVAVHSAFPPDHYVPAARFSDGAVALYLGHLGYGATAIGGTAELSPKWRGGSALLPADGVRQAFAYFGDQKPHEAGRAHLLLDPATPAWLDSTFRAVVSATTGIYDKELGFSPPAPLVLIAAGDLESIDGYSVKGGAVGSQIALTVRGRQLREPSSAAREVFEKLVAHELAHLWQQSVRGAGGTPHDAWIFEGGAEALAVAALESAGLWSAERVARFAEKSRASCREQLGEGTVEQALAAGRWDAAYSCGFVRFADSGADAFAIWRNLFRLAPERQTGYTQALFDEATGGAR